MAITPYAYEIKNTMKERLDYIDITKGVGIILVVLSHTVCEELMFYTSAFFVPVFFFCAGYTSSKKNLSLKDNFVRHAVKLLKPYLFFSILLLLYFHNFSLRAIVGILYSRYCLYPFGTDSDICHLFIIGNYPMWFLTCMVIAYLLYYIIIYHCRYQYYIIALYLIITAAMASLPILLPWSLDTAFLMAVVMYAGTIFRQYFPDSFANKLPAPIVTLAIVIYLLLLPLCHDINLSVRMYGPSIIAYFLAAVTGSILLVALSRFLQNSFVGRGLRHIGRHSLTIFCIEIPFVLFGEQLADTILAPNILTTAIIQTVVAIVGGYLLSLLLHQNKSIERFIFH